MKKEVVFLLVVNILWGFIPLPAAKLFDQYSIFLLIFIRFLLSGLIIFITTFFVTLYINKKQKKRNLPQIHIAQFVNYLKSPNLRFLKIPQWGYLLLISIIGFNLHLILFFWGLKTLGAIVTSIGFIIGLIIAAFYNWATGKEDMTPFKLLYLTMLFIAMIIIGAVSQSQLNASSESFWDNFSWVGLGVAVLYGIFLGFFLITSSTDVMTPEEFTLSRQTPFYPTIRILFKTAMMFLISAITIIPLLYIIQYMGLPQEIYQEIRSFFYELPNWIRISFQPDSLVLIIVCTALPFLVYYLLAAIWPKNSSFEIWAGVLSIVEPVINIVIGLFLLKEEFPTSWLLIVIILMILAIITRYLSETESSIQANIFFKVKFGTSLEAMKYTYSIPAVKRVIDLLGEFDFMIELVTNSSKEFILLLNNEIRKIPGMISYEIAYISSVEKDEGIPESEKGKSPEKRIISQFERRNKIYD